MNVRLPLLTAALVLGIHSAPAQVSSSTPGWFPFPISGLDASATELDLSGFNEAPAGKNGFVRVEGSQFLDGKGQPVRWLGVNLTAGACFPPKEQASNIAGHLAKSGVNIVRFHFLDNPWDNIALLKKPDFKEWNPEAFDRFDYFVNELKKRGIYSNINLHVGRTYEGTPKNAPNYSKGLDNFHPPFIAALKDYSKTIFEHKNPYTGNAYKDEPAVACVEVNNENSLALNPWWLLQMPDPFAREIRGMWNDWLGGHFGSTATVQRVFGVSETDLGPDIIDAGKLAKGEIGWRIDRPNQTMSTLNVPEGTVQDWKVLLPGDVLWWHQLILHGLTVPAGQRYEITFKARSKTPNARITVNLMQDGGSYANCGLNEQVELEGEWKTFTFRFEAKDTLPGKTRISFGPNNLPGEYEFDAVSLKQVPAEFLRPGQTVEAKSIPLPDRSAAMPVRRAFFEFLSDVETRHAVEMRDFLRHDCKVKAPIAHSQVLFGGMLGALRETTASDFIDNHGYWQHPSFPRSQWDMKDWEIANTSQLRNEQGGTLAELTAQRPFGKPYVVSEYDIPAPNDFAAETWPMFAALASTQDWSGIYIYNYCDSNSHWDTNKITGFFSTLGHPAKAAFMPWSSLVFRQGLIQPAPATGKLAISAETILTDAAKSNGDLWGSWRRVWAERAPRAERLFRLQNGLQLQPGSADTSLLVSNEDAPQPHRIDWNAKEERFELDSPHAALLLGKLGKHFLDASGMKVETTGLDGNGHGAVAIVTYDGNPLKEASRVFITAMRRAENPGMGWDEKRTTVSNKWGEGTALVQGLKATITLPPGAEWKVLSLKPDGSVKQVLSERTATLEIDPAQQSVWYLAEKLAPAAPAN